MKTATQPMIESRSYVRGRGWSEPLPANLDSEHTLVVAFGSREFEREPAPIHELREAFPSSHLIGCSTAGEVSGTTIRDESVAVGIVHLPRTTMRTISAPVRGREDSERAGTFIAEQLAGPGLRGVLVLSDGLCVNGSALVRGITNPLENGVVVTGGLAGDGSRFERTWVIRNGEPESGFVTAVGFYGNRVRVGHGSKGGWDVFGPERVVTKSEGSVLYELDGKPALPLYKHYLGDVAKDLPASALLFPLELRRDRDDNARFVRTILSVDETTQSMTFAGDIPCGYLAQLMRANFDRLIEGAAESALMTRQNGAASACLSIVVSCVGRRLVLGERTEEELERAAELLPEGSVQVGFYSYGEISPFASGGCDLHNQTLTLTTITEE